MPTKKKYLKKSSYRKASSYKKGSSKSYYSKRPLWQWILIYVVVGALVYAAIYYFVIAIRSGYSSPVNYAPANTAPTYKLPGY